jgi:hypothetical protein
MLKFGIVTIALLVLGAVFHVQPTAAQAERAAQRMSAASPAQAVGPDLEKLLMARGKPALIISFDEKGGFSPFRAEDATVRELDQPVPPEGKDIKAYTVYFYHKNSHCYTFWNGSKWVEVCPRH